MLLKLLILQLLDALNNQSRLLIDASRHSPYTMWFNMHMIKFYLRNEFDFWKVHGIMNTSGLLQTVGFTLTLQETQSIHGFMNLPKN